MSEVIKPLNWDTQPYIVIMADSPTFLIIFCIGCIFNGHKAQMTGQSRKQRMCSWMQQLWLFISICLTRSILCHRLSITTHKILNVTCTLDKCWCWGTALNLRLSIVTKWYFWIIKYIKNTKFSPIQWRRDTIANTSTSDQTLRYRQLWHLVHKIYSRKYQ